MRIVLFYLSGNSKWSFLIYVEQIMNNNNTLIIILVSVMAKGTNLMSFSTSSTASELSPRWTRVASAYKSSFHWGPVRCLPPQTRLNLNKSPPQQRNPGLREDTNKDQRVQGPQIGATEISQSLTNHSGAVSRVILMSCLRDRWMVVNLRGNSDVAVCTRTCVCVCTCTP